MLSCGTPCGVRPTSSEGMKHRRGCLDAYLSPLDLRWTNAWMMLFVSWRQLVALSPRTMSGLMFKSLMTPASFPSTLITKRTGFHFWQIKTDSSISQVVHPYSRSRVKYLGTWNQWIRRELKPFQTRYRTISLNNLRLNASEIIECALSGTTRWKVFSTLF